MTALTADRIDGVNSGVSVKAPVKVATTANLAALSGLLTVDGVTLVAGDRVLVKNQTTATYNGIYVASSTSWERAKDFDGNRDVKKGTLVLVTSGTVNAGYIYKVTTDDPITIDTSSISFAQAMFADGDAVTFTPEYTTHVVPRSMNSKARQRIDMSDHAASDGTDVTTAVQGVLDYYDGTDSPVTINFPRPSVAWGLQQLRIKSSNMRLIGDAGGKVKLKYVGTAASALPIIRANKTSDHSGENYVGVTIENFELDGDNKALHGILAHGLTKLCHLNNLWIHQCVNPLKLTDCYYLQGNSWYLLDPPDSCPSGMAGATFNANLYGIYADVCNLMTIRNLMIVDFGGDVSNSFSAALWLRSCEGMKLYDFGLEQMLQSGGRYMSKLLDIQGSVSLDMDTGYIEGVQVTDEIFDVNENSGLTHSGTTFLNDIRAARIWQIEQHTPLVFAGLMHGENLDISDRVVRVGAGGSVAYGVRRAGHIELIVGAQTATKYSSNSTTNSKQGIVCDPIVEQGATHTAFTGYKKRGYTATIDAADPNDITITGGEADITGAPVGFLRNSSTVQLIRPDLSVAATWNLNVGPFGNPSVERVGAERAGSAYSLRLGTFTTAGGGAAPTSLVLLENPASRLAGSIYLPVDATHCRVHGEFRGTVAMNDNTDTALFTMTLSNTATEDDAMGAVIEYISRTTAGATASLETGTVRIAISQDSSLNRATPSIQKICVQSRDAGQAPFSVIFTASFATNVCTVSVRNDNVPGDASRFSFTVRPMGGNRATSAFALATGVTALK